MRPRVLWVDDDDRRRFTHIERAITRAGWELDWAEDISRAAELLHKHRFDALILDQMIPGPDIEHRSESWAAYRILCWLRGVAPTRMMHEEQAWRRLDEIAPAPVNRWIPVVLASGYHDAELLRSLDRANGRQEHLRLLPKPVDRDRLLEFLSEATPAEES
jgi:CheY-like chemotaxis protein